MALSSIAVTPFTVINAKHRATIHHFLLLLYTSAANCQPHRPKLIRCFVPLKFEHRHSPFTMFVIQFTMPKHRHLSLLVTITMSSLTKRKTVQNPQMYYLQRPVRKKMSMKPSSKQTSAITPRTCKSTGHGLKWIHSSARLYDDARPWWTQGGREKLSSGGGWPTDHWAAVHGERGAYLPPEDQQQIKTGQAYS